MDFPVDSVHKVTISIRLSLPTCLPSSYSFAISFYFFSLTATPPRCWSY